MSAEAKTVDPRIPEGGAPRAFEPWFCAMAKMLCERGATDPQLAKAFGVTLSTIKQWQADFEEFSEACRLGKEAADAQVEDALLKRATGYTCTTEKVVLRNGSRVVTRTQHHVPPDIAAAKFWLRNRDPVRWRKEEAEYTRPEDEVLARLSKALEGTALRPRED